MNLDLILENIRLKHIETLLQEATTDLEVVRGQRLINESIMQLRGALLQEAEVAQPNNLRRNLMLGGAALGAAVLGDAAASANDNWDYQAAAQQAAANNPEMVKNIMSVAESSPHTHEAFVNRFGPDYVNGLFQQAANSKEHDDNILLGSTGALTGGLAGATLGSLGARRLNRR